MSGFMLASMPRKWQWHRGQVSPRQRATNSRLCRMLRQRWMHQWHGLQLQWLQLQRLRVCNTTRTSVRCDFWRLKVCSLQSRHILMPCQDMTLAVLQTEWEQLHALGKEFHEAASGFEKLLDRAPTCGNCM